MARLEPCFFLRLAHTSLAADSRPALVKLLEQENFTVSSPPGDDSLLLLTLRPSADRPFASHHLQCFATEERLSALSPHAHLFPVSVTAPSLLLLLQRGGLVSDCGPLHSAEQRRAVWETAKRAPWTMSTAALRAYFGEEVAYYFEWMNLYSQWLLLPGVLSLLLWAHSIYIFYFAPPREKEVGAEAVMVDRNPWVPFYTFVLVVWAFCFNKLWLRRSNALAFEWGTWRSSLDEFAPASHQVRPSFWGTRRISPVTGEPELHYPAWRRRCKYLFSAAVTGVMLAVAFVLMICSLNLQGYVDKRTRFGDANRFYISSVEHLRHPGAIFDSQGPFYKTMVPTIIHSLVILVLNQMVYKRIAEWLTEWENHKTEDKFEHSLIIKRFLFDAFDSYVALFYLAFYECDVMELRTALVGLYTTDSIRRIVVESVVPLIGYFVRGKKSAMDRYRAALEKKKKTDEGSNVLSFGSKEAIRDLLEEPYEIFDDYLEMVIQFGYIMLFASAFPLAACLSIATNWVELRSDAFKLTHAFRRPSVRRPHGIGMWRLILQALTWLAVVTNVFIFAFSSEQMMQWFPFLFKHVTLLDTDGEKIMEQELRKGAGRYVLGLVFVLEHALILIGLSINAAIDNVPATTRNHLMKAEYEKAKMLKLSEEEERE